LLDVHMEKGDRPAAVLRREQPGGQRVRLRINDGPAVKFRIFNSDGVFKLFGHNSADHPDDRRQFFAEMERLTAEGRSDWEMRVDFCDDLHDVQRARVGWLRSAYLATFAVFGYTHALGRALNAVREQIVAPEKPIIDNYHFIKPDARMEDRAIVIIKSPEGLAGMAVQIGWHLVFLPRRGADDFYAHLSATRPSEVTGDAIDWPKRAMYVADQQSGPTEENGRRAEG
jgi:hypothetical protein